MAKTSVPYAGATSGASARDEITKILRRFGCSNVGFMDDYERHEVLLAFEHGNRVQLRASAQGWANMYLRENPWTMRRSGGTTMTAVYAITDAGRQALSEGEQT